MKRFNKGLVSFICLALCQSACANMYKDQRSRSPHFKDGKFHNANASSKGLWAFLKMRVNTTYAEWPDWVEGKEGKINPQRVKSQKIHINHINHSTVVIQTEGLNILTDPIYSDRCSPVSWAGPKRVTAPGVSFEKLPKIDVVIISHDHYDHLDLPTIEKIIARDNPIFYFGLGVGQRLPKGANFKELDWWESAQFNSQLKVNFVPVQHFSGRGLFDRNSTLWGGFVLEFPNRKIYFGGDSGYAEHYKETYQRFGSMDLALIPIGAYAPRSFMAYAHLDPAQAVLAHIDLQAKKSIGIHYGTFQLTAEPVDSPVDELKEALKLHKISTEDFLTPAFGQTVEF